MNGFSDRSSILLASTNAILYEHHIHQIWVRTDYPEYQSEVKNSRESVLDGDSLLFLICQL